MIPAPMTPPPTSAHVRARLVEALRLDLIGPAPEDSGYAEEILPESPSRWYLTGFLVPFEASESERSDDDSQDQLDLMERPGKDDDVLPDAASARRSYFPSSMGLSVLVPAGVKTLEVLITWGDYVPHRPARSAGEEGEEDRSAQWGPWKRVPRQERMVVRVPFSAESWPVPESQGLELAASSRKVPPASGIPAGTRAVALFLVNRRKVDHVLRDTAYAFQAELRVSSSHPFVPRSDVRGRDGDEWDEQVADLQYRDAMEYAVGHNISARTEPLSAEGCFGVRTTWLPTAGVEKVIPGAVSEVELCMETLAAASSHASLQQALRPLVASYQTWIQAQGDTPLEATRHRQVAQDLLSRAALVAQRIEAGIDSLSDPLVFEAFCIANRAIATAIRQRNSQDSGQNPADLPAPAWYPFQLAFLLMNLFGLTDGLHRDREVVDLLFFPTGGGKTEAYLGLAAFTLVLRRLKNPGIQGAGLSVLMRYTLRLLTLDQLGRAATLICALELERRRNEARLGPWPFEIGLWVGEGATPNRMGRKGDGLPNTARMRTLAFQANSDRASSPLPLERCPWCGERFKPNSFDLRPTSDQPRELLVRCVRRSCAFRGDPYLPLVAVDEPLYRRLPCFVIATVDKFASLPWVGETGQLFGAVERYDQEGFYGAMESGRGRMLPAPLLPPDLIIQDELHLISGPLGTMVGLYEAALDALATREVNGQRIRPKIVASTATVRRASRQIRALFGRAEVDVFPPPGPNRRDSFFACTAPGTRLDQTGPDGAGVQADGDLGARNPRLYLGVAALGRNPKVVLLRTYLALLGAAQKEWEACGGKQNPHNPADPYMTLLGYFNSLRELGGSRRIVEDEVNSRLTRYDARRRLKEPTSRFASRQIDDLPEELTSRVSTGQVSATKERLACTFEDERRVDVALATNMISVGLDIVRLGLMVVLGQPKTAAEYIQATSRVGRDEKRPGLVVTLLNVHRPRDRSHYERFESWHASFYRAVEATSVTPFSPRAIDRGLAAITVALARHGLRDMTAPPRALGILKHRKTLEWVADRIAQRAELHDKELTHEEAEALRQKVRARVLALLDDWEKLAQGNAAVGAGLQYQQEVPSTPRLLYAPLDPELKQIQKEARQFRAARSLRDVEPSVNLWVKNPKGVYVEGEESQG